MHRRPALRAADACLTPQACQLPHSFSAIPGSCAVEGSASISVLHSGTATLQQSISRCQNNGFTTMQIAARAMPMFHQHSSVNSALSEITGDFQNSLSVGKLGELISVAADHACIREASSKGTRQDLRMSSTLACRGHDGTTKWRLHRPVLIAQVSIPKKGRHRRAAALWGAQAQFIALCVDASILMQMAGTIHAIGRFQLTFAIKRAGELKALPALPA